MKNSKLIAILFFSFLIFTSRPALVEETLVNSKNLPEALNDIFATKYVNYYLNDNNFFQKYKRTKYELLAEIIKYYKRNKIDINKPVKLLAMELFFHDADILGLAILTEDSKLVELLLNNGVKVKSKYIMGNEKDNPLILNKSMAEMLIPRGATVPNVNQIVRHWISNPKIIDEYEKTPNEIGVEYIKYLVENGSKINQNTVDRLERALAGYRKNLIEYKPKVYNFFDDIKKYLQEKLDKRNK